MHETARARALGMVNEALRIIQRLRAMGPNPFDYWIWADETAQMLETIFGRGAAESLAFTQIISERGRTLDQRGNFDSMTLGIHGEWGIRARLDRAEAFLQQISARLNERTPSAPQTE